MLDIRLMDSMAPVYAQRAPWSVAHCRIHIRSVRTVSGMHASTRVKGEQVREVVDYVPDCQACMRDGDERPSWVRGVGQHADSPKLRPLLPSSNFRSSTDSKKP